MKNNENKFYEVKFSPALVTIWLLFVALVSLLAWGNFAKIEQSSRAMAQVIASSRTQFIQAANDGEIARIYVSEGGRVKKGEILVRLDQVQARALVADAQGKVAALKATLVRLRSEVLGRPLVFPEEVNKYPSFVRNQTDLFNARQKMVREEKRSMKEMLETTKTQLKMTEALLKTEDVAETEVLSLQRQVYELEGNITNRTNKYFQDSQAEMTKAEEDLVTQEQLLAERTEFLDRTEIYAPTDGVVRNVRLTTPGARVRAGDVVMEILPTDSKLIVEAKLKPSDLAFIKIGANAAVKLDAYDYTIYGVLHGKVSFVSPDALTEESKEGSHVYYRVHVVVEDMNGLKTTGGKKIEIQPGMTAQVEIRTGSMSALNYFTKPITKTLSGAFSER